VKKFLFFSFSNKRFIGVLIAGKELKVKLDKFIEMLLKRINKSIFDDDIVTDILRDVRYIESKILK